MMEILKELGLTKKQLLRIIGGKQTKPKVLKQNISDKVFTFGVVSDTHLCSTHEKLNELWTFYEICRKEGIKTIVHCGDLIAGWGIYKGQENEVHTFGVDNQVEYVIKHYPKVEGITTYFITGNHCLSWLERSGVDIGVLVEKARDDMVYLGQYQGDVDMRGVIVRLFHGGGNAYAISYKLQKVLEQIPSGDKPHIFISGHYHTSLYFFYRLIHAFQAGCFESQTLYLIRKGINPTIGGWTIKVRVGEDKHKTILSITPTFIPFLGGK